MKKNLIPFMLICFLACKNQGTKAIKENSTAKVTKTDTIKKPGRPISFENGKFFKVDGREMLYGGKDSIQHFDITDYDLKDEQFHYGMGRELFPALLNPEFTNIEAVDSLWKDDDRFIVAYAGNDVKAYSVKDLTRHEVVNDVLNGEPIMAVYCILADLGAIYDRQYGDKELTFALSGYTYYDDEVWDGLDGFVLWDRETESLWWPLIGRAISGSLKGVKLLEKDKAHWEDTTWKAIKEKYPNAQVLKSGQDFERPNTWKAYDDVSGIVENYSMKND